MAANRSKSGILLLDPPEPYADETFGSWFRRLAACQASTRCTLAASLLNVAPQALANDPELDWDLNPPPGLIRELAVLTRFSTEKLTSLFPPDWGQYLRVHERDVYCPRCWDEDLRTFKVHQRRQWLHCWSLGCRQHEEALQGFKLPADEILEFAALLAARHDQRMKSTANAWANTIRANGGRLTVELLWRAVPYKYIFPFRVERPPRKSNLCPYTNTGWNQPRGPHDIAGWVTGSSWYGRPFHPEEATRDLATVIKDLTLLVGSDMLAGVFTGCKSLLAQWEGPHDSVWLDDSGAPLRRDQVRSPRGTLLLRRRAVNLAFFIWKFLYDPALWGRFRLARATNPLLLVLAALFVQPQFENQLRESTGRWSPYYRSAWVGLRIRVLKLPATILEEARFAAYNF